MLRKNRRATLIRLEEKEEVGIDYIIEVTVLEQIECIT
jgi:hypothetical protein